MRQFPPQSPNPNSIAHRTIDGRAARPLTWGVAHFCGCAPRGRYKNGAKVGLLALSLEVFDVSGNAEPTRTAIARPLVAQALLTAFFFPQAQGTRSSCLGYSTRMIYFASVMRGKMCQGHPPDP